MDRKKLQILILIFIVAMGGFMFFRDKGGVKSLVQARPKTTPSPAAKAGIQTAKATALLYQPKSQRDPFALPEEVQRLLYGTASGGQAGSGARKVEGFIWGGDKPQAIIDSRVYSEGDVIGGGRILKIDKNGVVIEENGERTLLK